MLLDHCYPPSIDDMLPGAGACLSKDILTRILAMTLSSQITLHDQLDLLHYILPHHRFYYREGKHWECWAYYHRGQDVLLVCKDWYRMGMPFLLETFVYDGTDLPEESTTRALRSFDHFLSRNPLAARLVRTAHVKVVDEEQAEIMARIFKKCGTSIKNLSWSFCADCFEYDQRIGSSIIRRSPLMRALQYLSPVQVWTIEMYSMDLTGGEQIIREWVQRGLQRLHVQLYCGGEGAWVSSVQLPSVTIYEADRHHVEDTAALAERDGVEEVVLFARYLRPEDRDVDEEPLADMVHARLQECSDRARGVVKVIPPPTEDWISAEGVLDTVDERWQSDWSRWFTAISS